MQPPTGSARSRYDAILVGTGFASSFFLQAFLEQAGPRVRVLVLERGRRDAHSWQIEQQRTASLAAEDTFVNQNPQKRWVYNPGFGGGSNCWWACTPRMLPNDFRLRSRYGVGVDWPLRYDELEPYYQQVEETMAVSGPEDGSPFPRSQPYPQPPHRFSDPDRLLKAAYPDRFFQQPTARPSRPTAHRPMCCASGVCRICPVNAKFTIANEMAHLYADPRVSLILEATVETVETRNDVATGVTYTHAGTLHEAHGDLVVLGANALFNPQLLLRSGLNHPLLGRRLSEQIGVNVTVDLDGVDNFQGSTSITGHGYMLYDGAHRAEHAACLIETWNVPSIRLERGKWRQRLVMKFIFEDLPAARNHVRLSDDGPHLPETVYEHCSEYTQRAIDRLPGLLPKLLRPLPVEQVTVAERPNPTEEHIIGTTVMGEDPAQSVVDRHLLHHRIRNLAVLGSSVFPTCAPANPTLTLSALSLWCADHLLKSRAA